MEKGEKKQLLNKKTVMKKMSVFLARLFVFTYVAAVTLVGTADSVIPDKITVTEKSADAASVDVRGVKDGGVLEAKLFGTLPIKNVDVEVIDDTRLVPCGNVFGVKFFTRGVIIIKMTEIETKNGSISPAKQAGLKTGDIISSINGKEINTVEEMAQVIENSKGEDLEVVYVREGAEEKCVMTPCLSLSDRKYKTGIWVRDSTAGIGTMTYYNPRTGAFAGLGHGICDVDTGELMPLLRANVVDVEITDIIKGKRADPGEIKGSFDSKKKGVLTGNTEYGVYGIMDEIPENVASDAMEIGLRGEVQLGRAHILSELDNRGISQYEIEISKIEDTEDESKNLVINITDERLLNLTGGIIQGMSGSPIIQNGKLIGAVTHVLVNNPVKGYGIFIENMLVHESDEKL